MSYQNKYLKYKNKYLDLKKQTVQKGGECDPRHKPGDYDPMNMTLLDDNDGPDVPIEEKVNSNLRITLGSPPKCYHIYNLYHYLLSFPNYDVSTWYEAPQGQMVTGSIIPKMQYPLRDYITPLDFEHVIQLYAEHIGTEFIRQEHRELLSRFVNPVNDTNILRELITRARQAALNNTNTVIDDHLRAQYQISDLAFANHQPGPQILGVERNYDPALGHTRTVYSVAVMGDRIISCRQDCTIKIWERNQQQANRYTCTQTLGVNRNDNPTLGHTDGVTSVVVMGDRIVSSSLDSTIKIWAPDQQGQYTCTHTLGVDGNLDQALGHTDSVYSLAVDGDRIISGGDEHTIRIWVPNDAGVYTSTRIFGGLKGHTYGVSSVAVMGDRIVSCSIDGSIKIWERNRQGEYKYSQTLGVNNHTLVAVDGIRIISGSYDHTIKIWERNPLGSYTCTQTLGVNNNPALGHTDYITSVQVIGDRIVSSSKDNTIKIWTLNPQGQYTCTHILGVHNNHDPALRHTFGVTSVAVIGNRIISGNDDHTIKIWNMPL